MGRFGIAVLTVAIGFPAAKAWPQNHHHHHANGGGGNSWDGLFGHSHLRNPNLNINVGSYGYNAYSYFNPYANGVIAGPGYAPFLTYYTPPVPRVIYGFPPVLGNNPLAPPVFNGLQFNNVPQFNNNFLGWNQPPNPLPVPAGKVFPPVSTAEAKLKSIRAQAQGDMWFQQQEFHKAFDRYKTAVSEAGDRGEAHLRLAVCYAALGHPDLAARQLKRGLAADPQFAAKADSLKTIYGNTNAIAQSAMVQKAMKWVKEDIRDPDRLFLLGALLYLQGDERATVFLETGMELASGGEHFQSLLTAVQDNPIKAQNQVAIRRNRINPQAGELPTAAQTIGETSRTLPPSGLNLPLPNR